MKFPPQPQGCAFYLERYYARRMQQPCVKSYRRAAKAQRRQDIKEIRSFVIYGDALNVIFFSAPLRLCGDNFFRL